MTDTTLERTSDVKRFWSKVDRRGHTDCWPWTGYKMASGRGRMRWNGRMTIASRISYEIENGPVPSHAEGTCILHTCDNPNCVNPAHLWAGTNDDNVADRERKGRGAKGEGHARAKLGESDVREIRRRHEDGASNLHLAKEFGVHANTISAIIRRVNWAHLT